MNIKAKAAAITAGLIVGAIVISALIHEAVTHLTTEQITTFVGSVFGAFFVYCIYQVILSRLEYQNALKKARDLQG